MTGNEEMNVAVCRQAGRHPARNLYLFVFGVSVRGKAQAIDLVVLNLYPFEATVAKGSGFDTCIENIDIGGPSMLRR